MYGDLWPNQLGFVHAGLDTGFNVHGVRLVVGLRRCGRHFATVFVVVGDEEGVDLKSLMGTEIENAVEDVVDWGIGEIGAVEFCGFNLPVGEAAVSEEALWEVGVLCQGAVVFLFGHWNIGDWGTKCSAIMEGW